MHRRFATQIVFVAILVAALSASYTSALTASSRPRVTWTPNPVTINVPTTLGHASAVVSLTCKPNLNGLLLTPSTQNDQVILTVTPKTVPECTSAPTTVTLTATLAKSCQSDDDDNNCTGESDAVVDVDLQDNYFGGKLGDNLKVKIIVSPSAGDFDLTDTPPHPMSCTKGSDRDEHHQCKQQEWFQ